MRKLALAAVVASLACSSPENKSTTPRKFTISGTVSGAMAEGVSMSLTGAATKSTITGADGSYSFSGLPNGSYTVTPSLAGYVFSPGSADVAVSGANVSGTSFSASVATGGNVIISQLMELAGGETGAVSPGHANYWDLDSDFSIFDGGNGQFSGALWLSVGMLSSYPPTWGSLYDDTLTVGTGMSLFPADQTYDELRFLGPLAKSADGNVTAVAAAANVDAGYHPPLAGTCSGYVLGTSDSRLSQQVTLPSVSGGETLTLGFTIQAAAGEGYFGASYGPYFRVAVRAQNGSLLGWALPATPSDAGAHTFDLTSFAGQTVTLSFELRSNGTYAVVDDVSVVRSSDPTGNLLSNGDFESCDLTGWIASDAGEPTGIASGPRTVDGLSVQRFFYTVPGKKWARIVDVLSNDGSSDVAADIVHVTTLGSNGAGQIFDPLDGTANAGKAISAWDTNYPTRDVGLAYGGDGAYYVSVTGMDANDGQAQVFFVRSEIIPPGQKIVLVYFVVMDGTDTGLTATDLTARATEIDAELALIADGVRTDAQYLAGMTSDQVAAIANW